MTLLSFFGFRTVELTAEPAEVSSREPASRRYCRALTEQAEGASLRWAWQELEKAMTIVPAGDTRLAPAVPPIEAQADAAPPAGHSASVMAFYVDRFAVSNDDFACFVEDGGYSQADLWAPPALAHLLQFVDQTGNPAPRYWSRCQPPKGKGKHPVVGVSWFEAQAFARWSGKQLLSPAQWQWAGIWSRQGGGMADAKYPWGSSFDPKRANTWASGVGDTVPVDEYYSGATPNGAFQLIGNVWEWVGGEFGADCAAESDHLVFEDPPAEVRGGAFDTYLETQSSCVFRSCQSQLYRGDNVGFRCCLALEGLPSPPDPEALLLDTD